MEVFVDDLTEVGLAEERLDDVKALANRRHVAQREYGPALQHTRSHRRCGAVDDVKERRTVLLHAAKQLQRSDGELVKTYITVLLDAAERRYMTDVCVLRHLQILHDGTCSHHAKREMLHTEALERLRSEMLEKLLTRTLLRKHPVVQLERTPPVAEAVLEFTLHLTVMQHLLGLERHQQLLHIIRRALPY